MSPQVPQGATHRSRRALAFALIACVATIGLTGCHEEGSVEVKEIAFDGVKAFPDSALKGVLATRQSGWLPWSPRHYFDRSEFDADLARIHAYYADHGYPNQRVSDVKVAMNPDLKSVRLRIVIDEGEPVIVDQVRYEGFGVLSDALRGRLDEGALQANAPRDRDRVRASRDLAVRLLRDNGYPLAYVDAGERPNGSRSHVVVTFRANTGREMRFGDTAIDGLQKVDASIVRRYFAFQPGDLYRESRVLATQRRLSSLQVFELAAVKPRPEDADGDRVPVRITVAEGRPRRLKFGVGYGSEERGRGSFEWTHSNFLGGGRVAQLNGSASFLDQNLKASLVEPRLGRLGLTTELSIEATRTSQLTYDWQSYGTHAALIFRTDTGGDGIREPVRYEVRGEYMRDYLKYGIHPDSLDDLSQRDERIALGLDPTTGRGVGTLGAVGIDLRRAAVDDVVQPRRGTILSLHLQHAAPWLLGTYRFNEVVAEARAFVPVGGAVVWANRFQYGSIGASDPADVPFAKRYFLGGATTLRGWGRYQVGPLDEQGLQIGGRTLVLASSEVRFPLRGKLSGVAFADAGNVGSSDWSVERMRLRVDIGPGLRYATPIGSMRADFGYQLTPIDGLVVNGTPALRKWRLHLSIGQAF